MKKIISVFMILIMLFSLTACGDGKKDGFDKSADLAEQADSLNKNDLSEDEVADVEKQAELDGYSMYWKDDGRLVLDPSEEMVYLDGEWVDSRFTRLINKPTDGFITEIQILGNRCSVMMNWSAVQANEYANELKDSFKNDVTEDAETLTGAYSYYGVNDDGVELHITRSPSTTGMIAITFPEE